MDIGTIITLIGIAAIITAIVLTNRKNGSKLTVPTDYDDIKQKLAVKTSDAEAKTAEITGLKEEIAGLTDEKMALSAENSRLTALRETAEQQKSGADEAKIQAESQRDAKQERINELEREIAGLSANLKASEETLKSQKAEIQAMQESAKNEFKIIASRILEENTEAFNKNSKNKLDEILKPLSDNLGEFKKKVELAQTESKTDATELKTLIKVLNEQSKQLGEEAKNLALALKGDSKVQGDWGEFQLEVLLEKLGFEEGLHYRKQANFKDENNYNVRPDFVINLPESKHCVIDCKVSLTAYERYFNSEDEGEKKQALNEHLVSINKHVRELSDKKYEQLSGINSPDFVFMFVPIEAALMLAVQNSPSLIEDAAKKNVMLVTTSTLLFALRTVAYIWKVENQNKNVQEIAAIGGDLYDKFVNFTENMLKVGNQMDSAKSTYENAMKQLTKKNTDGSENAGTIVGKIESMKKLGANATKQISQSLLDRREE